MILSRRTCLLGLAHASVLPLLPAAGRADELRRVVSVGGTLTEIVYALGRQKLVVATDTTSTYPDAAKRLPKVGYMRQLAAEGILSLAPDLVLASPDAGPEATFGQLRAAGVTVAMAPEGEGRDVVAPTIRFVGRQIGEEEEAEQLVADFEARMARVEGVLAGVATAPRVIFLISASRGTPLVSGRDTAADAIIRLARGDNAISGFEGYKPLSAEAAITAGPDFVLMPDHAAEAAGGADRILARPEFANTPAGRDGKYIVMDGLKLLGFGPRTPEAVAELARALHPDRAAELVF